MLDFTNLPTSNKLYPGGSGAKRAVIYQGEQYLLKFPATSSKNKNSGHSTSYAAEYIGCHIFNSVGIRAQDTILGIYRKNDEEKVVVACKDFTSPGVVLQDFASLQNSVIDYGHSCYSTELSDIMQAMEAQTAFPPAFLKRHFWDMFIVDALNGNFDRHGGNWGFIKRNDQYRIAPVYDNGSSLYPKLNTDEKLEAVLSSEEEIDQRIYKFPTSHIKVKNRKSSYFEVISSLQFEACNDALKRIVPRIDFNQINTLIDEVEGISEVRKRFYKVMLQQRYEKILMYAYRQL